MWRPPRCPASASPPCGSPTAPTAPAAPRWAPPGPTAACIPCGSALGATWNPALVAEVGAVLGAEARTKGARVLLAPTVNMHRSPLAGRNFECYSEDPLLSAAGRRVRPGRPGAGRRHHRQAPGRATTPSSSATRSAPRSTSGRCARSTCGRSRSRSARAAAGRHDQLQPGQRPAGAPSSRAAADILRDEWGFEGFVVTDWFGVAGTVASAEAGSTSRCPAPARASARPGRRGAGGEVDEKLVDAQVRRLLTVFDRIGALDDDRPRRRDRGRRPEHRGRRPPGGHRGDGAAGQRRAAAPRPHRPAHRGRHRPQRRPRRDHGRRLGVAARPTAHARSTPCGRAGRRRDRRPRAGCDNASARRCSARRARRPRRWGPGLDVDWFAGPDLAGDPVDHRHCRRPRSSASSRPCPALGRRGLVVPEPHHAWPEASGTHVLTSCRRAARLIVGGDVR